MYLGSRSARYLDYPVILGEFPVAVNARKAHVTPHVETLPTCRSRSGINVLRPSNSWLDREKIREMTIVGSRRMIVVRRSANARENKIYDVRVERPPHYGHFCRIPVLVHYGDSYIRIFIRRSH